MRDEEVKKFEARQRKLKKKIIESHASQLAEHFDSVQIICTQFCPQTGAGRYDVGRGNYYARLGSVDEWLADAKR